MVIPYLATLQMEDNGLVVETLVAGGENMFSLGGLNDDMQYFPLKYTR